jgi:hypothetical protein
VEILSPVLRPLCKPPLLLIEASNSKETSKDFDSLTAGVGESCSPYIFTEGRPADVMSRDADGGVPGKVSTTIDGMSFNTSVNEFGSRDKLEDYHAPVSYGDGP